MNALINKLTNVSYEFFGIFIPGLIAIIGFAIVILLDLSVLNIINYCEINSVYLNVSKEYSTLFLALLLFFSYLAGHGLKWVSKDGIGISRGKVVKRESFNDDKLSEYENDKIFISKELDEITWNFLFLKGQTQPNTPYRSMYNELAEKIGRKLRRKVELVDSSKPHWRMTYPLIKAYMSTQENKNLLANYQNKYTFHRSLASFFSLLAWLGLLSSVVALYYCSKVTFFLIPTAFLSYILAKSFSKSFIYFWYLYGSEAITQAAVCLAQEKNGK